jgi:hypothetical protein
LLCYITIANTDFPFKRHFAELCLKGVPDYRLELSQGIYLIQFNPKADCARWKANVDQNDNPRLTRKFKKWKADNFIPFDVPPPPNMHSFCLQQAGVGACP